MDESLGIDTDECLGIDAGECLDQYGRVLRKDTDEYQKVKHRRVFESIRTSIERRYRRLFRELTTRQKLGLEQKSVLILLGIEKVKVTDWGLWA